MFAQLAAVQGWCPWCGDHMAWGGWGMMFGWTLFLLVVVCAVWAVARGGRDRERLPGPTDRAEAILREEHARGEIDEEAYRRRLEVLRTGT